MKYSKIFSALALAIVFSLLIWIIPPAPAMAQTIVSVNPISGHVGTSITVSGTGFTAGSTVSIYFPNTTTSTGKSALVDASGNFAAPSFEVGEYPAGSKTVWVSAAGTWHTGTFTITPKVSLSPTTDYVGQDIAVDGTGFTANKDVTITFYTSATGYVTAGTASTNANGSFSSATFTVPESYRGSHTVKAVDGSSKSDTTNFTTKQSIAISPESGAVGDEVTVTGTGFGANKYMSITYAGDAVTISPPPKTGANGSFSAKFNVPSCVNGTYEVKAKEGTTTYVGTANFVVSAGASLNKATGNVGTSLTVTGTGFVVNATVTVTYAGVQVATAPVGTGGTFSATFNVPVSISGSHIITVTDAPIGTNTETLTFTMESTPPSIPTPLLPEMGTKANSRAEFDWEDVTDPSLPVTYTLQIATDADFTSTSTVLTKEGITTSAYTLTKEEKLESTKEEAPYYWRIKAIDGASNESGWSGAGTFYVSGFSFGDWFKYVLYVLGGLALVALGFWLGRRIAYY